MMSPHGPSTPFSTGAVSTGAVSTGAVPPPWVDAPPSLEERLRVVRERCRLLADVFSIQAEAAFLACHVSLSPDAFNALTDLCRSSADDLERLAQDIPGSIANWQPGAPGLEGVADEWDRRKNPVDGDERP